MAGAGKRARWGRRHTLLALCVAAMFLSGEDCLWQRLVQSEPAGYVGYRTDDRYSAYIQSRCELSC